MTTLGPYHICSCIFEFLSSTNVCSGLPLTQMCPPHNYVRDHSHVRVLVLLVLYYGTGTCTTTTTAYLCTATFVLVVLYYYCTKLASYQR